MLCLWGGWSGAERDGGREEIWRRGGGDGEGGRGKEGQLRHFVCGRSGVANMFPSPKKVFDFSWSLRVLGQRYCR